MFQGFLDRRELETAIKKQYPDLTESMIEFIQSDLDEMETLMTKSSADITAGMVMVSHELHNELAFNGWM